MPIVNKKRKHYMSSNNEIKQLKKQLALVTEERDLLKKAAAYFAVHSQ